MDGDPIDQLPADGRVSLYLTKDEAVILEAFLTRGQNAGDDYSGIEDQSELRVLWDMCAILESRITAVVAPDYDLQLAEARSRVRDSDE
jgi:hypothetical protein